jgi:hypothetical protein
VRCDSTAGSPPLPRQKRLCPLRCSQLCQSLGRKRDWS